jgi:RNA polymerase sigma-54 factor
MRTLLTPRMIQSMEILQLPLAALEERIEQELQSNPVLEQREPEGSGDSGDGQAGEDGQGGQEAAGDEAAEDEKALVLKENSQVEDFQRLDRIGEYFENEEFLTNGRYRPPSSFDGERDKKQDALNNTAARGQNLTEYLLNQWVYIEAPPGVARAGKAIIKYINAEGYLAGGLEAIQRESKSPPSMDDLQAALKLVQTLEPAGVGARDLRESLLLQLDALDEEDDSGASHELERKLVAEHLKDLEMNRYPQISRKLGRPIDQIKAAVKRIGRLHPHPGKQIGYDEAPPITPDAVIYFDEDTGRYECRMTHDPAWNLYISGTYRRMLKQRQGDKKTREFLTNNVRNARWLLESIAQRRHTILRVIRAVVDAQREFFDNGPEFLRPLPMIQVAAKLGIHVATVSRAVSEKWIQTPRGVFPLRRFFSGGTTSAEGEDMSWDAVKEKLKMIVGTEDTHKPLNDDELVVRLKEQGIELARRTVAKYRKILNISTARQRREF